MSCDFSSHCVYTRLNCSIISRGVSGYCGIRKLLCPAPWSAWATPSSRGARLRWPLHVTVQERERERREWRSRLRSTRRSRRRSRRQARTNTSTWARSWRRRRRRPAPKAAMRTWTWPQARLTAPPSQSTPLERPLLRSHRSAAPDRHRTQPCNSGFSWLVSSLLCFIIHREYQLSLFVCAFLLSMSTLFSEHSLVVRPSTLMLSAFYT